MSAQDRHDAQDRSSEPVRREPQPAEPAGDGGEPIEPNCLAGSYLSPPASHASTQKGPQPEEALREWEERLLRGCPASFEGILVHDNGRILDANQTLAKMVGYELSELIGMEAPRLVAPEWRDVTLQKRLAGCEEPYEAVVLRKDGSTLLAELRGRAIPYDGRTVRVVAIRDITERKRAEEALRESEHRYRTLFEDSPISLWDEDFSEVKTYVDGLRSKGVKDFRRYLEDHPEAVALCATMVKVADVNRATLELYKATSKEEFQSGLGTVFGKESYDVFREELVALAQGKTVFESEAITRTLTGDKNHISLKWRVAPGYEQTLSKVYVSIMDVTERERAEEALRQAEGRYRLLFEQAPAMYVITRNEGGAPIITDCNELFLTTLGHSRAEVLGRPLADFYGPESRIELLEHGGYQRALEGCFGVEGRQLLTRDGRVVEMVLRAVPELDDGGRTIGTRAMYLNITERRRAEEALRESEKKFRTSVENMLDCFGIYSAIRDESGRIVDFRVEYVNEAACANNLMRKDEQVGKRLLELLPAHRETGLFDGYCRVVETGVPLAKESLYYEDVYKEQRLLRAFDIRAAKLGDGFAAAWRDITERKRAEEALAYQAQLLASVNDAIISTDEQFILRSWNPAAERIYGWKAEEVLGRPASEVLRTDFPGVERSAVIGAAVETGNFHGEVVQYRKDGTAIQIESKVIALRDRRGCTTGYVGVNRDITERKRAEEALRESERRYRLLAENVTDVIWTTDLHLRTTYISPSVTHLWGYSVEEVMTRTVDQMLTPASLDVAMEALAEELAAESTGQSDPSRSRTLELESVCRDGSTIWTEAKMSALRDECGRLVGILGVSRDITERMRVHKALEESERRYRLLAENATDMIWTTDMNSRFTYVSPSVTRLGGYSVQEMMGGTVTVEEALTPASLQVAQAALAEELAVEETEQKDLSRSRTLELEHVRKDGSTVWAEVRMTFLRGEDGRPVGILGVTRDISERRRAQTALEESERRYRLLAENATDIIWIRDMNLRIIYINPAVTRIRGYSVEEAMAHTLEETLTPASLEVARKALAEALEEIGRGGLPGWRTLELEHTCKDGSTVWLETTATGLRDEQGRVVQVLGASRDISERKRAEEALQKAREELESRVERRMGRGNAHGLTFRELTVLHLVAAGQSDKEIAATLGISTLTASKHLANILRKMGAASRTEAGVRAVREGLLD